MAEMVDFDARAAKWIKELEKETGQSVKWFDMYLKQKHLKDRQQYHRYKIDVKVENVRYNAVTSDVKKPGFVYREWFHNGQQSTDLEHNFKKSTEFTDTYSWSVTRGLTIAHSMSVSVGIPEIFGGSSEIKTEFKSENTKSKTKTKTETFSSEVAIKVAPQKSVKAIFTVNEREMDIPWEADVIISGSIAVWFNKKHDGHWLWFYSITHLSNKDFKVRNGKELWYHFKGKFHGVHGIDSDVRIEEYPLQPAMIHGSTDEPAPSKLLTCDYIVGKKTASSGDKLVQICGDE